MTTTNCKINNFAQLSKETAIILIAHFLHRGKLAIINGEAYEKLGEYLSPIRFVPVNLDGRIPSRIATTAEMLYYLFRVPSKQNFKVLCKILNKNEAANKITRFVHYPTFSEVDLLIRAFYDDSLEEYCFMNDEEIAKCKVF